jgi:hypothetical protein
MQNKWKNLGNVMDLKVCQQHSKYREKGGGGNTCVDNSVTKGTLGTTILTFFYETTEY